MKNELYNKLQSYNKSKPLANVNKITINLQLELLNKCQYNCVGCFVNRKNSYSESDLNAIYDYIETAVDDNIELNEIILGPTDIFTSSNTIEILSNNKFRQFFKHFQALSANSTLLSSIDNISKILSLMDNLNTKLEIFVVFDVNRIEDNSYISDMKLKLELFKHCNIIFIINTNSNLKNYDFKKITDTIYNTFKSRLKFVPSFFRSNNQNVIKKNLFEFKEFLNESNIYDNMITYISDQYMGGHTYFTFIYSDSNFYLSPFYNDPIFIKNANLIFNKNDAFRKDADLLIDQYNYAEHTTECVSCEFLGSCISKYVLSVMKILDIDHCIMPKSLLKKMNRT